MSSGAALEIADAATADYPAIVKGMKAESITEKQNPQNSASEELIGPNGERCPTEEDWASLRRVFGKVNWMIYVIGIVEMCERFAYYGTTAVCTYIINDTWEMLPNTNWGSCQFHPTRPPYRRSFSLSGCCWHKCSGWSSWYGATSFHWPCSI